MTKFSGLKMPTADWDVAGEALTAGQNVMGPGQNETDKEGWERWRNGVME